MAYVGGLCLFKNTMNIHTSCSLVVINLCTSRSLQWCSCALLGGTAHQPHKRFKFVYVTKQTNASIHCGIQFYFTYFQPPCHKGATLLHKLKVVTTLYTFIKTGHNLIATM